MATLGSYAETSRRQDELTDGTENHTLEWRAPPLAPTGTTAPRHPEFIARKGTVYADECAVYADEDDLLSRPEQNDLSETGRTFSSRRKLTAGTAIVAALGVCASVYFLFASPIDKTAPQTAEVSAPVQPIPASSVETALNASGSSAEPDGSESASSTTQVLAAEPIDASRQVDPVQAFQKAQSVVTSQKPELGVSQKVVSAASAAQTEPRMNAPAGGVDILFLQRPGVHIRSTPSKSGSGIGTAPKGTRFKVLSRKADWIQVQNGHVKGWVNAQFLAPTEPR